MHGACFTPLSSDSVARAAPTPVAQPVARYARLAEIGAARLREFHDLVAKTNLAAAAHHLASRAQHQADEVDRAVAGGETRASAEHRQVMDESRRYRALDRARRLRAAGLLAFE